MLYAQALKRSNDLNYFTHEVDGRLYGGWYRSLAGESIEVYARGQVRSAPLAGARLEEKACRLLEDVVRSLPRPVSTTESD